MHKSLLKASTALDKELQDEARGIVAKLDFYNELLRNYASVLTMMMHLRQLCCHRELVAGFDFEDL